MGYMELYHGTNESGWIKILSTGFLVNGSFLTQYPDIAKSYGREILVVKYEPKLGEWIPGADLVTSSLVSVNDIYKYKD